MPANKVKKLVLACGVICISTALTAAPQYYGILELGSAQSKFKHLKASTPEVSSTTDVVEDSDSAAYFSIGIGMDWASQPLRSELVYSTFGDQSFIEDTTFPNNPTFDNERTTTKIKQESLMLNLLYDINIESDKFKPYIGAGVGISKTKVSAIQEDSPKTARSAAFSEASDTNFMWSLIVGANYNMTEKAQLGFGYRYTDAGNVSTDANCIGSDGNICDPGEKHSADLTSHLLFVNMNYYFK